MEKGRCRGSGVGVNRVGERRHSDLGSEASPLQAPRPLLRVEDRHGRILSKEVMRSDYLSARLATEVKSCRSAGAEWRLLGSGGGPRVAALGVARGEERWPGRGAAPQAGSWA